MRPGGRAIIPALQIRMSSLDERERNFLAPVWMDSKEARSISRNVMGTEGSFALRSVMRVSARVVDRPVKNRWDGACAARASTVSAPIPAVPGYPC